MSFNQMTGQPVEPPVEPNVQGAGTETAPIERPDQCPAQLQELSPGSAGELDGYISYAEMQKARYSMGELLHRIVDFCLTVVVGPHENNHN